MDYPAGTVLGMIRIELCFDLSIAIVFPASSQIETPRNLVRKQHCYFGNTVTHKKNFEPTC
jgi:hypothetical protein